MHKLRPRSLTMALVLSLGLQATGADASFWPLAEGEVERGLLKSNVQARRSAARKIAELSPAVARPALEQALSDQDREVRLTALRTARAFDKSELAPLAFESLKSRDPVERIEAVRFIALEPNGESIAALEAMASDADPSVRRETVQALGNVPEAHAARVTTKLLGMLDDSAADVRLEVAVSLGRLGQGSAVLALAARLNDPEPEVRAQVALALGAIGAETTIPALQVALLDPQDSVVTAVVTALGSLNSEDVIVGLLAIAEKFPRRPQGMEAIEALVRLSKYEAARRHVVRFFESSEHRAVLQQVFLRDHPESVSILTECVRTFSSDVALECAYSLSRKRAGAAAIIEAQEQGRLSASQVLDVLGGVAERAAIVLALERLSLGEAAEFRAALRYLASLDALPQEAEAPIVEALTSKGRTALDVANLAQILGSVRGIAASPALRGLLTSTDDAVRFASASALVRRGAAGKELREFLLADEPIASGALGGLGQGMTPAQAEVLIRLTEEGRSGRRSAYLSVFFAMPAALSSDVWRRLFRLYQSAQGSDRDALLYPLVRAGSPELLENLFIRASRADKLKIAQLSWYAPRALPLVRRLIVDSSPDVAALAAQSLGRNGTPADGKTLGEVAVSSDSHTLRAGAVLGLTFLVERGQNPKVPDDLFSPASCESSHDAYRAQVTRLAAVLGRPCGGRSIEDVLLRDRDPRRRLLAAELIRKRSPQSRSLRTCRFYESRSEVADLCWATPGPSPERRSEMLPYEVRKISAGGRPLPLTPFAVRAPGSVLGTPAALDFGLRLLTDRGGQIVIPNGAYEAIDPDWFF